MKATGKVIAGGLLACAAAVVAAGPALAVDADAPGAQQQGWDGGDDGHGRGEWHHPGGAHDGDWGRAEGRDGRHNGWHDGWHHGGWGHHRGGAFGAFHELGLTDAQRSSIKQILVSARPAMKDLREKMRANFKQLRDTSPDDKNFARVAARVSSENGALTGKLLEARAKVYAQCYALLAPIQKTHLAEIQARRAKWMEEHGKDKMDGHDPHHHDGAHGGADGRPASPPPSPPQAN
jgi:periplasmic protein CpxP/Spy